jgi:hypothetical protein
MSRCIELAFVENLDAGVMVKMHIDANCPFGIFRIIIITLVLYYERSDTPCIPAHCVVLEYRVP